MTDQTAVRTEGHVAGPDAGASPHVFQMPRWRHFGRNQDGATAVEFGLIAVPFVTMLLGIMSVCLYFFTVLEVENAVWQGSRDLRVGNVQQGLNQYNGKTGDALKDEVKKAVCARMRDATDCFSKLRLQIQNRSGFGSVTEPNCKATDGNIISNTDAYNKVDLGGASSVLVVTGCYAWDFGAKLPFFKLGNLANGSYLVQATYTFRTEPYN